MTKMNLISTIKERIYNLCLENLPKWHDELKSSEEIFSVTLPKEKSFGDFATNIAMILAAKLKINPRQVASEIASIIEAKFTHLTKAEIAGPGFINLSFSQEFFSNQLKNIHADLDNYGRENLGKKQKINLEFGSPNPTGPIHVGHTRGSIFGDVLARLLSFTCYEVTKENYFNDAGKQIDTLARSLFLRYKEQATKTEVEITEGLYPGPYLIPIAEKIYQQDKDKHLSLSEEEYLPIFKEKAVSEIKELIKEDFAKLGITHDVNFSELTLHQDDKIAKAIDILKQKGLTYYGCLEKPKGKADEDYEASEQLLFKATKFGDDSDRALARSDGSYTYFAADLAYHQDKISRGYDKLILILGADHGGYVKRMKAIVGALSDHKVSIDIKLCQLVNYLEDGKQFKMSKRAGTYVTADDVVKQIGVDALRFLMLTRKNDMIFDFDLKSAIEESKDNPVFYVQYAHARICSVFRKSGFNDISSFSLDNLDLLNEEIELDLIKQILLFPELIKSSAINLEPHKIAYYLHDLASMFHSYWNLGKNSDLKFLSDDQNTQEARLLLLNLIRHVIANGLTIFNVKPLEEMR